jgi:hypothetical protein
LADRKMLTQILIPAPAIRGTLQEQGYNLPRTSDTDVPRKRDLITDPTFYAIEYRDMNGTYHTSTSWYKSEETCRMVEELLKRGASEIDIREAEE